MLRKLFFSLVFACAVTAFAFGQSPAALARDYFESFLQAKNEGDFLNAETYLNRILELDSGLSVYQLALVRNNLGYVYYETGRYDAALEQYRMAGEQVLEPDQRSLQLRISIHINQGLLYSGLEDYTNSLDYYSEAERLLRTLPGWNSISYAKLSALLLNKGIALYHSGRLEEARGVLEECAQIKKEHNHAYMGSVYFNLARVCQGLGDMELSRENYLLGIAQWTFEYDSNYYELANIYLHFGQFLVSRGQPEEGFEYLQKALHNYRENYGPLHPLSAACYERLAWYSMEQSRYTEALDYLEEALDILEYSGHDLTLLKILATKSSLLEKIALTDSSPEEKTEHLDAALATNAESIEVLQGIQQAFFSAESRVRMTSRQKDLFTAGIRLNLEMFRLTGKEEYTEKAFLMAARGKSGEFMFEINNKEWLYLETLTDTLAIGATELKQQIARLSNLIRTEKLDMKPDSVMLASWQNQLFQTRDSFNRNMEQLRRRIPEIGHFELERIHVSADEIQENLKRGETLLEYYLAGAEDASREQLFIFAVTRNTCHFYQSEVDPAFHGNLETIMDRLHGFVPYEESGERFDSLTRALFEVYQELIQPVEPLLHTRNLLIVPDERLSYIPFDALITHPGTDSMANYAGLPYLLKDYNISYLYNSQLMKRNRPRALRFPEVTAWIPGPSVDVPANPGRLKWAMEEVKDILELVKGRSLQQAMGKQEVINLLEEDAILHLAMHSLATESTGISPYFIVDNQEDPRLQQRLHDYEINALSLSTPMVVLSSCETAGGYLQSGEGIRSLSRSFLQAGASAVVHTLWPVDDTKSRELMLAYYSELKRGHSKSKAISMAKRQYLEMQPPFYTHPYYWAAFQVTGDPVPLQSRKSLFFVTGAILMALMLFYSLKRRSFFRRT